MGIPSLHRVPTNHLSSRAPRVLEERLHARKALLRAATLTVVPAVSSPAVLRGLRVRRLPLARPGYLSSRPIHLRRHPAWHILPIPRHRSSTLAHWMLFILSFVTAYSEDGLTSSHFVRIGFLF